MAEASRDRLRNMVRGLVAGLSVLLVVLVLPGVLSPYGLSVAVLVFFYIALAEAWNLFSGYTGYVNFGYAAFIGLGAYGAAVSIWKFGWTWPLAILVAGLVPTCVSLMVALVLRARGAYFAIAMLGVAESARLLVASKYLRSLTNAGVGIPVISDLSLTGQYFLTSTIAVAAVLLTHGVARSEFGLRLLAIREDELASRVLNINVTAHKVVTLAMSAGLAGMAGGAHAIYLAYIEPDAVFSANFTLQVMVMGAFGGLGTVMGPVFGAVLFTLVDQMVTASLLTWHFVVFGLSLIAVVLLLPDGVLPWAQKRRPEWRIRGL